jgi:hypothetical protein
MGLLLLSTAAHRRVGLGSDCGKIVGGLTVNASAFLVLPYCCNAELHLLAGAIDSVLVVYSHLRIVASITFRQTRS